ncbi:MULTISPECIES: hypothetical protein [unclassified Microcoleus]|uniref:hypothetical protein n=1 Tax=unclassified Microcoleus TaxID=2642155 RepID=UPI002FD4B9B6
MVYKLLIAVLCLILTFPTVAYGFSDVNTFNDLIDNSTMGKTSKTIEKSDYYKVREALSATEFIESTIEKVQPVSPLPFTPVLQIVGVLSKVLQLGIYLEDWGHTDSEIVSRINDVLTSVKLENSTDTELYIKFEKYVKTTLQSWIPDRDYPQIGYLPKKLLYNQSLGESEITKYWPEAPQKEQAEYVALTFDELILNYQLLANDFH